MLPWETGTLSLHFIHRIQIKFTLFIIEEGEWNGSSSWDFNIKTDSGTPGPGCSVDIVPKPWILSLLFKGIPPTEKLKK